MATLRENLARALKGRDDDSTRNLGRILDYLRLRGFRHDDVMGACRRAVPTMSDAQIDARFYEVDQAEQDW